jgi:hypothetical protein
VEAISAQHLKMLIADKAAFLVENIDDPELTPADRGRLLDTLHARRRTARVQLSIGKRLRRALPMWSARAVWRTGIGIAVIAGLFGPPLRNTTELAVVTAGFSTAFTMPNGALSPISAVPGQTAYVRRWLRWTPVAVVWVEETGTYATAPVIRSAVDFSGGT